MIDDVEINKNIRVLVVDDHVLTRDMVRLILKGLGFNNIVTAESAVHALNTLNSEKIEMVICDWNMPNMTGLELLQQVRSQDRYKDLPFLMLTAEAYRENVSEAAIAGVSDYIAKPFTSEVLQEKIKGVLRRSSKQI